VVFDLPLDRLDFFRVKPGILPDSLHRFFGDDAELRMRLTGENFYLQPDPELVLIRPDLPHPRTRVAGDHNDRLSSFSSSVSGRFSLITLSRSTSPAFASFTIASMASSFSMRSPPTSTMISPTLNPLRSAGLFFFTSVMITPWGRSSPKYRATRASTELISSPVQKLRSIFPFFRSSARMPFTRLTGIANPNP